ncbi:GerAB/ArcD/ProY family transporter [Alkalibacillus salilacus]|uniref:Spore germination protein (Amino acid permease) n=1 Tax=Alkalibacillus salilacus TaxID=284582 RepID=A0ABT9VFZ0_9BACI|nr:GerAB/ArcD/ProY family transporter [Alkalibacillus salilacus]MDQ0159892.1 spore germination protein (amino acid permease) [Alkalibacillus salilacus]
MPENLNIPDHRKLKAVYLIIVLHTMQIGVGIAGYPRIVFMEAGRGSLISLIIAAIALHIIIACIVYVLRSFENQDLHGVLTQFFGKWFGKIITFFFIIYFFMLFLSVQVNYIEFVRVFIFPDMSSWLISLFLLSLVLYAALGGVRVAVGASIVFFFGAIWMVGLQIEPMTYIKFDNYLPMFEASPGELLSGALKTSYTILGFELLWVLYPYLNEKNKVHRYSQLSMSITVSMIIFLTFVSIGFFSDEQLKELTWPVLSTIKIISFPMFERFDIVTVALWMIIVLPNLILLCWMTGMSVKRVFGGKETYYIFIICLVAFICQSFLDNRYLVGSFTNLVGQTGILSGFLFPVLMVPFAMYHRRKGAKNHGKQS